MDFAHTHTETEKDEAVWQQDSAQKTDSQSTLGRIIGWPKDKVVKPIRKRFDKWVDGKKAEAEARRQPIVATEAEIKQLEQALVTADATQAAKLHARIDLLKRLNDARRRRMELEDELVAQGRMHRGQIRITGGRSADPTQDVYHRASAELQKEIAELRAEELDLLGQLAKL